PSRPPAPARTCSNGCACAPIRSSLTSVPASWRPASAAWSRLLPQIPAHQRLCFLSRCSRSNGASNANGASLTCDGLACTCGACGPEPEDGRGRSILPRHKLASPWRPGTRASCSRLAWDEHALTVGEAQEEPEPGEVVMQRVRAVVRAAGEPGQGRGEAGAVVFQPVAEELEQLGKLRGVGHIQGNRWHCGGLLHGRQSRGRAGSRAGNGTTRPPGLARMSRSCWFSRVSWWTARTRAGTSARSWASSLFLAVIVCRSLAMMARSRASSPLSPPRSLMRVQ